MSRKRRMFDIDLPADLDAPTEVKPSVEATRGRGPMAAAIVENAEAVKARQTTSEAIRAENDALAHELVTLREAGHVVALISLEDVYTHTLVRDRIPGEDYELESLVTSIKDLGLSNPIRVIARPDGTGYELVQGYRRLGAYKALRDAEGNETWGKIPALVMPGEADIAGLYRRMVDENVIRKDLSFAEMAHAAQSYAADPATGASNLSDAVAALFQSAAYSKRSYIRSFAYLLDRIGPQLNYPTEIPRALGVTLARNIKERPEIAGQITADLADWEGRTIKDELTALRRYTDLDEGDDLHEAPAAKAPKAKRASAKTTFHIKGTAAGQVKCTAAEGRLEIKANRDFTSMDRSKLEKAIAALVDGLA